MTHRIPLILAAVISLTLSTAPRAGTLVTRDGQTYTGSLQLLPDQATVTTPDGPKSFPLAAVAKLDFKAGAATAPKDGHGLRGEYFAGRTLARLALVRTDPGLDYDWREALPHPSFAPNNRAFSARWTGQLRPDHSETYKLITRFDDGYRVWLDNKLIVDRWFDQSAVDTVTEVALEKDRKYDLKIEYYNAHDAAAAVLAWSSPSTPRQPIPAENLYLPQPAPAVNDNAIALETPSTDTGPAFRQILQSDGSGLKGEYFASRDLDHLNFVRFDPNVDFHFTADNPPDPVMSPEGSVRWTGLLEPRFTEDYRFHAEVHRRVRLWINEKLVIDQWKGEGAEYTSDKIPLTAGKKVPFRLEFSSANAFMLCRLRWSSKSQGRDTIPPDAFSTTPGDKLKKPVLGLVYPTPDAFVAAPNTLALLATGLSPNAPITKVEFFDRGTLFGEVTQQPYRIVWKTPPPGVYNVRAKLTDAAGVTALTDPAPLTITGKGDGSLQAPWGDFYVSNLDSKSPGTASFKNGTFTISKAIGTLTSDSEHDAAHFVVQPLVGDGQIIARVVSLDPMDDFAAAMAGITIRENLKNRCKQYSMLFGQPGEEPIAAFVRRSDHWTNPNMSEKVMKAPLWFKLARHGDRVYAYTSTDGKAWDLYATEQFKTAPQVFVGLTAFSKETTKPATAVFDHVQVLPGAPPLDTPTRGFLTRGGTFVAADVFAIDGNLVRYNRDGKELTIPLNDVARILFKPLLTDHAEKLSPGRTGLLMSSGDFLEGELKSLKDGHVSISSILFGLKRVWVQEDLTAIVLHDVSPAPARFTLTTTDGSHYRAKSLTPTITDLTLHDTTLGPITIPLGSLAQLQSN